MLLKSLNKFIGTVKVELNLVRGRLFLILKEKD